MGALSMADTQQWFVRAELESLQAARQANPELADVDPSTLFRVGLLVLAGHPVTEAVPLAKRRRGPKSKEAAA
jgi:hypothetical protein